MKHFGRKAAIAAVAFATVGSTVFGGAALANDKRDGNNGKPGVTDVQDASAVGGGGGDIGDTCRGMLSGTAFSVYGDATGGCNPTSTGGAATAFNLLGL